MKKWIGRALKLAAALFVLAALAALVDGWRAFGKRASGDRRARIEKSPQFRDGQFRNPQPLQNSAWGMLKGMFQVDPHATPSEPPPAVTIERERFATPPASGLRVTWLGHSTVLVEIDGARILTDPIFSDRAGPVHFVGPRRYYAPPIALADLPPIDAVVISHDHYDHLDYATLSAMKEWNSLFVVPLGVGAHLEYWGIPFTRIRELDWWERERVRDLEIVCTPARHASGRVLLDNDATLWSGFAILGPKHRAYYAGDTGLFPAMREIGAKLGPFDVTLIEVGQYHQAWPDWHIGPEQAMQAHQLLRGRVFVPVHWGLYTLAFHGWTEPVERAIAAAQQLGATIAVTRPGQSLEPSAPTVEKWWPSLPHHTAADDPIISTQTN